jgi:hypothetical protein
VTSGAEVVVTIGDVGPVTWSAVTGKPTTFPPQAHSHEIGDVTGLTAALAQKVELDPYGKVQASQLPSFVDDVLEYANAAARPATGETGKIYVTIDNGKVFRWSGSQYIEISAAPGSTDAVPEGTTNLYHTTGRAAAAAPVQSVAGRTGAVTLAVADVSGAVSTTDARLTDAREWSAATVTQAEAEAGTSTSRLAFSPLRVFQAVAAWWAASSAKTKLDGISAGATANATDAQLRDRATHTGFQTASTISDFATAVVAAAPPTTNASLLTSGTLADARLTANVVLTGDSRLSNARTPTSHASTHQTGGSDAIAPVIVTPSSLSASQNDYAPGVCDIIRLSSSTAIDLTGLVAGTVDGAMRLVINTNASGGAAITLKHESASSTAANRFRSATNADVILLADGGSVTLTYSTAISRWRIL